MKLQMNRTRISGVVLGVSASVFAAGQIPASSLLRDSTIASSWKNKTVDGVASGVEGLGFASSGNATISGGWGSEIWSILKSKRKPNTPFKFLVLTRPSNSPSQNGSVASDVLVFAGSKDEVMLVHECVLSKGQQPVSAVVKSKNGVYGAVLSAWQADTVKGAYVPVDPQGVTCASEQSTAE